MSISKLWARITGQDNLLKYPTQQTRSLGRTGEHTIVYPYCIYCDLVDNVLLKEVSDGAAIPVTVVRPQDLIRGEPTFFHPQTNARIVMRNNGDIDIFASASVEEKEPGSINIYSPKDINVTTEKVLNIKATTTNIVSNVHFTGELTSNGKNISDSHIHIGSPTAPDGPISDTEEVV